MEAINKSMRLAREEIGKSAPSTLQAQSIRHNASSSRKQVTALSGQVKDNTRLHKQWTTLSNSGDATMKDLGDVKHWIARMTREIEGLEQALILHQQRQT